MRSLASPKDGQEIDQESDHGECRNYPPSAHKRFRYSEEDAIEEEEDKFD